MLKTMKYYLSFIIIFWALTFGIAGSVFSSERFNGNSEAYRQQEPFYFLNDVPPAIKLPGRIDLSFFKNRLVVFMYRYRLQIPNAIETAIDRSLIVWSPWLKDDFTELIVPRLDLEGGHKLVIEFKEINSDETKRFEMPFYVYRMNLSASATDVRQSEPEATKRTTSTQTPVTSRSITNPAAEMNRAVSAPRTATEDQVVENVSAPDDKVIERSTPEIDKLTLNPASVKIIPDSTGRKNETSNKQETVLEDQPVNQGDQEQNPLASGKIFFEPAEMPLADKRGTGRDYNKLLVEAIENNNAELFRTAVQNGAGREIIGEDGGNIFHLMNDSVADDEVISYLKNDGMYMDEPDKYGNTPLHVAILSGNKEYASSLINQGAELNIKNRLDLTPLHLAAISDNRKSANDLMIKGAEINMQGNSGYTALHIASELNYISLAKDLLYMGAKHNIKTEQKLTPADIARIQNNYEMNKLIRKKGSYSVDLSKPELTSATMSRNYVKINPKYDFILTYDNQLAKKRHLNKVLQIISVPVFALSTSAVMYMKSEADKNYSLSKIAETEELARIYYNKTKKFDTYTYISGGISLISVYGIINSAIKKRSIERRMLKTFY